MSFENDANHLRLLSEMDSGSANALRYAYTRLDTIDRKSSELFRAHTSLFAAVLTAFSITRPHWDVHHLTIGATLMGALMVMLIVITIIITYVHMSISRLRFYRMPRAGTLLRPNRVDLKLKDAVFDRYVEAISRTTCDREESLSSLHGFFWAALLLELLIVLGIVGLSWSVPQGG